MAAHFHPFPRFPAPPPLPPFPRYLTFRHSLELVEMLRFRSRCYLFRAGRALKNPHRSRFSPSRAFPTAIEYHLHLPIPSRDERSITTREPELFRQPTLIPRSRSNEKLLVDGYEKSRTVSPPREEGTVGACASSVVKNGHEAYDVLFERDKRSSPLFPHSFCILSVSIAANASLPRNSDGIAAVAPCLAKKRINVSSSSSS